MLPQETKTEEQSEWGNLQWCYEYEYEIISSAISK